MVNLRKYEIAECHDGLLRIKWVSPFKGFRGSSDFLYGLLLKTIIAAHLQVSNESGTQTAFS